MNHIDTIEELVEKLDHTALDEYAKVLKNIKIPEEDISQYSTWIKQGYTRNCLSRTPAYELILLCWDIGAKSPIHGHGGEDCWVYQIQGTVEEVRFEDDAGILKETNRMVLTPGKLTYMHDRMGYHTIANISEERAMTLHIYASPIDSCEVYNDEINSFVIKELSYHTFKESNLESPIY